MLHNDLIKTLRGLLALCLLLALGTVAACGNTEPAEGPDNAGEGIEEPAGSEGEEGTTSELDSDEAADEEAAEDDAAAEDEASEDEAADEAEGDDDSATDDEASDDEASDDEASDEEASEDGEVNADIPVVSEAPDGWADLEACPLPATLTGGCADGFSPVVFDGDCRCRPAID